jgi:hypothetical protein
VSGREEFVSLIPHLRDGDVHIAGFVDLSIAACGVRMRDHFDDDVKISFRPLPACL